MKKLQNKTQKQSEEKGDIKEFLDLILPSVVRFYPDYLICGNTYRSIWAIREYPASTE